jgi:HEPN domain-containing protein
MRGTREELVRSWLVKAFHDLLSAHELASAVRPLLDTAAYHCQQAAEKAIKGYLLFHDIRFEKSHDIEMLVSQAIDIDASFSCLIESARFLTPLAVEFRYPGDYLEPEPEEFQDAYNAAQSFYVFICDKLPIETHPPTT